MSSSWGIASAPTVPCGPPVRSVGRVPDRPRLTRRGRLTIVASLVLLLFGAFSLGRAGTTEASTGASTQASPQAQVEVVTVAPGETLWAVATRIAPGVDPRAVVDQIREINDLSSAELQVGQQLLLPAKT